MDVTIFDIADIWLDVFLRDIRVIQILRPNTAGPGASPLAEIIDPATV